MEESPPTQIQAQWDYAAPEQRQSVMQIRRQDVAGRLREQMFSRINTRRSQLLEERRSLSNAIQVCTPDELMGVYVEDLHEERPDDMTVEDWNAIYLEVTAEIHQAIAQQLIWESRQNDQLNFDQNERFSQLATEQQAEIADPNNYLTSVCAVCKNGVVRMFGNRLACEVPGCVDLIVPFVISYNGVSVAQFRVESLMNNLSTLVADHDSSRSGSCRLGKNEVSFGLARETDEGDVQFTVFSKPPDEAFNRSHVTLNVDCAQCNFWDYIYLP